ncbi:MAG: M1 family metallopeptidase [Cyclobacteriaceae bacterium]|nr:M1 family metallopeptidase [Cyclobacteriaceae bacterium]
MQKSYRRYLLALGASFMMFACSTSQNETENNEPMKVVDHHTYAKPEEAVITHLDWDASVNFDTKTISATASFDISRAEDANEIILDISGLSIQEVKDGNGQPLTFEVGEAKPFMGSPLTVSLKPDIKRISIKYTTSPGAEALQWLTPQQTADEKDPFLFTQSEAILARSWIPVQDSPGIRFTYNAHVQVPEGMLALMSASNPREVSKDGSYKFTMDKPIPAYLLALAVGDITYQKIGERTGVYAEPSVIKAAAYEFADMENMVDAAEQLYGPYQWGVYDVIVLPPSFPFGGMENPRLTFATPTILAGDRSLVSLIAHELAHSWSGNLVTNATWDDFWLNEGFTVYFEERIMEALYGRDYSEMLAKLSLQELKDEIKNINAGEHPEDTELKLNLEGRNPDDGMTNIAYDKGYYFLRLLEERFGREKFDTFLKEYFTENAFHSMTTEEFIKQLNKNLFEKNGVPVDEKLYQEWIYGEGLPADCPIPVSDRFTKVDEVLKKWEGGTPIQQLISPEDIITEKWSSHEWIHFIRHLPESMTSEQMKELDDYLNFTYSGNSEILDAWFVHAIKHNYTPAYKNMENFLIHTGRRKFLMPLYGEMVKTEDGKKMAMEIYAKARANYHYVATSSLDKILDWGNNPM